MLKILSIFGAIALGANILFFLFVKRKNSTAATRQPRVNTVDLDASPLGLLKIKQGRKLIQSALTELGISVEELDNLTLKEIMELTKKKEVV
jgi:hypothetical protein